MIDTYSSEYMNFIGVWERPMDWPFSKQIYNYATVSKDDHLFIIGGLTGESFEEAESNLIAKFADELINWTSVGTLQQRRYSHGVIGNSNDRILVIGGNNLRF